MSDEPFNPHDSQALERMAAWLRRSGFATPALLLIGIARPLGIVGGQFLSLLRPIVPGTGAQERIGRMASAIEDDATWTRLEKLLQ
jgi:hypothetical protein